jgi:hypothetical protein
MTFEALASCKGFLCEVVPENRTRRSCETGVYPRRKAAGFIHLSLY